MTEAAEKGTEEGKTVEEVNSRCRRKEEKKKAAEAESVAEEAIQRE